MQWGRPGFDPWVGKIPWRKVWQPTPIYLPGESPWTEKPGRLQSMGSQRVRHDWATKPSTYEYTHMGRARTLPVVSAWSSEVGKDLGEGHCVCVCSLITSEGQACVHQLSWYLQNHHFLPTTQLIVWKEAWGGVGWGGGGEEGIPFPYLPGILSFNILIFVKFEADTDIGMGQSWYPTHRDWFGDGHGTQVQPIRSLLQYVSAEAEETLITSHLLGAIVTWKRPAAMFPPK